MGTSMGCWTSYSLSRLDLDLLMEALLGLLAEKLVSAGGSGDIVMAESGLIPLNGCGKIYVMDFS